MNVLGSVAIASGWKLAEVGAKLRVPYVSFTVYGDSGDAPAGSLPSAEQEGAAAGAIFRAAEAAFQVDPYGKASWRQHRANYMHLGTERWYTYHLLEFVPSCDDVTEGGPLHRERASRCNGAMNYSLEQSAGRR